MNAKRGRGEGSFRKRGNIWWIRYSFRGEKREESTGSENFKDAVKLLNKRKGEMGTGRLVGPDAEKVTVANLRDMVLTDYEVNGRRSLRRVTSAWKHLVAAFDAKARALDVTADRLNRYVVDRKHAGASLATIQQELAALKRGFTLAIRAALLSHRPAFPVLHISNARRGFFEEGDFRALCAALPDYLVPVVTFASLTGWRIPSEVLPLTWDRVDFSAGVVRLDTSKNDQPRTFPFTMLPALSELLEEQRARTSALVAATGEAIPWVFHRHGSQIKDFRGAWKAGCAAAKLDGRIPHDFRRTAVRTLERAGVSRSVAMQLTGHKTESVYRRYAIVAEADLREGVAKLAALRTGTVRGQSEDLGA